MTYHITIYTEQSVIKNIVSNSIDGAKALIASEAFEFVQREYDNNQLDKINIVWCINILKLLELLLADDFSQTSKYVVNDLKATIAIYNE